MSRQPVTKWAQRSDKVLITIEIPDAKDVKLTLQDAHLHFSASTGAYNVPYEIDFDLYDKINVHESKGAVGHKKVCYILKKAEEKWWSRLLRQGGKPPVFLKADWNKWIDENDEPEKEFEDLGFGELEFSKLNMGGVEDDEMGEAKTTENPPSAKEFEAAAADTEAGHDAGPHYLGVDWSKMNMDMKKLLNMEHGAKQRAMFVDDDDDDEEDAADEDDDDDDEEDAADEDDDAANEEEGDEKKEAKAPPADQNVEDKPLTASEISNVQKHVQMILGMADMMNLMNALMDDGVAEDPVDEHEDDETETHLR